jgi:hypothetical protein
MKIVKYNEFINESESDMTSFNGPANISGIEQFAGKPLLGGYILDIRPDVANRVLIVISTEADKKDGKQLKDFTELGTAFYSIGERTSDPESYLKQWTWKSSPGEQLGQAEVADRVLLKTIGDQLEKDN